MKPFYCCCCFTTLVTWGCSRPSFHPMRSTWRGSFLSRLSRYAWASSPLWFFALPCPLGECVRILSERDSFPSHAVLMLLGRHMMVKVWRTMMGWIINTDTDWIWRRCTEESNCKPTRDWIVDVHQTFCLVWENRNGIVAMHVRVCTTTGRFVCGGEQGCVCATEGKRSMER